MTDTPSDTEAEVILFPLPDNVVRMDRARILKEDRERNRRLRECGDLLDITTSGALLRALGEGGDDGA